MRNARRLRQQPSAQSRNRILADPRLGRLSEHHAPDTGQREYDGQDVGLGQPSGKMPSAAARPHRLPMTPIQMALDAQVLSFNRGLVKDDLRRPNSIYDWVS